jgi:methionyl-tRNA formyltransferase
MRIVFMGTPDFAVRSLDALVDAGLTPAAVVTAPDKPRGRGQVLTPTPVKVAALRHGIPVLQPPSLKDETTASSLEALHADLFVVVAFRILPERVFMLPRLGTFNLHGSLLPLYRGAAPINWAIINGERETGVTSFFIEKAVDTGKMILQERIPIDNEDDAGSLHDKLAALGAGVVVRTVQLIGAGTAMSTPQDDRAATPAPKIFPEHCRIDWALPAERVRNFIRGLSPSPGATTAHSGKTIKIFRTRIHGASSGLPPGSVVSDGHSLRVIARDGTVEVLELQLEGKRRMGVEEFLRGYRFNPGDRFGS